MTSQRLNIALAVVFLCVGIIATSNTFRLNRYIEETLPRDEAQEQCIIETITVLRGWIDARINRDTAMDARDIAAQSVLDKLTTGQQPTPEELGAWRDAVIKDREVRATQSEHLKPLPDC